MKYALYLASGEITRTITCPENMIELQPMEGESFIELSGDCMGYERTHYVRSGELVALPPRPSDKHVFDYAAEAWIDPRTLRQLKDAQWEVIKADRDAAEFGGFVWNGMTFDSNTESLMRFQAALTLASRAGADYTIDWTLANNDVVTLTAADLDGVAAAWGAFVPAVHAIGRALRVAIEDATTREEVLAVRWPETT